MVILLTIQLVASFNTPSTTLTRSTNLMPSRPSFMTVSMSKFNEKSDRKVVNDANIRPTTVAASASQAMLRAFVSGAALAGMLATTSIAQAKEESGSTVTAAKQVVINEAGYVVTDSGLQYKDIVAGEGSSPNPGDTVRVHYTGWLDGFDGEKKFDSSYDRRSPLVFKAGVRQVIAGWDEALLTNLKVGGKRQVIIPPELGYGARGAGGVIPPNATLYFTMELVGIGAKANR